MLSTSAETSSLGDSERVTEVRRRRRLLWEQGIMGDPHMNKLRQQGVRHLRWRTKSEENERSCVDSTELFGNEKKQNEQSLLCRSKHAKADFFKDPNWLNYVKEAERISDAEVPLIQRAMNDIEEKAKHYFVLFSRERQEKQKLEQTAYWLEQNSVEMRKELSDQFHRAQTLAQKLESLRSHPGVLKGVVERIDLLYAQLDTLVQSLAGISCFLAYKDQPREDALMTVLDYLYPCRGLDPRLNALYGSTYYYKLGLTKEIPAPPVPPPTTGFAPYGEATPWLPPGARKHRGDSTDASAKAEEKALRKIKTATTLVSDSERAKGKLGLPLYSKGETMEEPITLPVSKQKERQLTSESQENNDVPITGFQIYVGRATLPDISSALLVFRYDHEQPLEARRKAARCTPTLDITPGIKTVYDHLLSIYDLPSRIPDSIHVITGTTPSFVIDLWASAGMEPIGSATHSFLDPETLKELADWDILDETKKPIGSVSISIGALPQNARMPARRYIDSKRELDENKRLDPSKKAGLVSSPLQTKELSKAQTKIDLENAKLTKEDYKLQAISLAKEPEVSLKKKKVFAVSQKSLFPLKKILGPKPNLIKKPGLKEHAIIDGPSTKLKETLLKPVIKQPDKYAKPTLLVQGGKTSERLPTEKAVMLPPKEKKESKKPMTPPAIRPKFEPKKQIDDLHKKTNGNFEFSKLEDKKLNMVMKEPLKGLERTHELAARKPVPEVRVTGKSKAKTSDLELEKRKTPVDGKQSEGDTKKSGGNTKKLGADTKKLGADTKKLGADTKKLGADTKKLGADTKKLGADTKKLGPDTKKLGPDTKKLGPDTKKLGPDTKKLGPDTKKLGADTKKLGPDTKKLGPDTKKLGPDTKKLGPDTKKPGVDVKKPGVDMGKTRGDTKKLAVDGKKSGVDAKKLKTATTKPSTAELKQPRELVKTKAGAKKAITEKEKTDLDTPKPKKVTDEYKQLKTNLKGPPSKGATKTLIASKKSADSKTLKGTVVREATNKVGIKKNTLSLMKKERTKASTKLSKISKLPTEKEKYGSKKSSTKPYNKTKSNSVRPTKTVITEIDRKPSVESQKKSSSRILKVLKTTGSTKRIASSTEKAEVMPVTTKVKSGKTTEKISHLVKKRSLLKKGL